MAISEHQPTKKDGGRYGERERRTVHTCRVRSLVAGQQVVADGRTDGLCQPTCTAHCSGSGCLTITHRHSVVTSFTSAHWQQTQRHSSAQMRIQHSVKDSRLTASFPRQCGYAGTRKVEPFRILMKQDTTGWQWHQLDHMQVICTSMQSDNHAGTSSLNLLQVRCSSWRPTKSVEALKAMQSTQQANFILQNAITVHRMCPMHYWRNANARQFDVFSDQNKTGLAQQLNYAASRQHVFLDSNQQKQTAIQYCCNQCFFSQVFYFSFRLVD